MQSPGFDWCHFKVTWHVPGLSHCRLGPEACLLLGEGLKVGHVLSCEWQLPCFYWCRVHGMRLA
jgi:hypothetical protein